VSDSELSPPEVLVPAEKLAEFAAEFGEIWRCPDLAASVSIGFSRRLRTSLGRAMPTRNDVRINDRLRRGAAAVVREVVGHELAHIVAYRRHGRSAQPHGAEWRQLMRDAGLEPRVRVQADDIGVRLPARPRYRHRCPSCDVSRVAGISYPRWRCARCLAAGRPGDLVIERA
jgi:SprT protein